MSGNDENPLTPDGFEWWKREMRKNKRRAKKGDRERAARERAAEERAEEETAEAKRAGEQAAQPAGASENANAGDNSLSRLSLNYLGIASGWFMTILQYLWKHPLYFLLFITIFSALSTSAPWLKFVLNLLLPVGGSLGSLIMGGLRKLFGLSTPSRILSCRRDGPFLAVGGKLLREIAQELDKRIVEGVELSFNEVFLLEVNRVDDRLADVTESIADHFYHVCRHISDLEKFISSEPSWLAAILQSLPFQYSKKEKIQNEANNFLSTLDHGITALEKMIIQTRAGHECIRKLGNELCDAHDNVFKIKEDVLLEISNLAGIIADQEKPLTLWQYVTRQSRDVDTAALKSESMTLWEKLVAAKDLRKYVSLGCNGSLISCSVIRKLEQNLNWNRGWSKKTMDNIEKTLDELRGNNIDWKTAGEELSETMKKYEARINNEYYGKA